MESTTLRASEKDTDLASTACRNFREDDGVTENKTFILNQEKPCLVQNHSSVSRIQSCLQEPYRTSSILIAGDNFGPLTHRALDVPSLPSQL